MKLSFYREIEDCEVILERVGICILCVITAIFFALSTSKPEAIGESDDYMLTTEALQNHFSLRITEEDVQQAKIDFPEYAWYFQNSWDAGMPALFSIKDGEVYPWYMGTYSLICIPMKICLQFLSLNQSYAFPLTNAILASIALWTSFFILKRTNMKKIILVCLLGFSPVWWYIRWPSAEVMIFALVVLALTFFAERNYFLSGLFVSIAGTLNIAVMALGLFMIIDFVKNTYMYHYKSGEKNVFRVILLEWKKIGLLILCYVPSLITPIFNLTKFGLLNLQSILGFATPAGYIHRVFSHLFDLNIGFLPYFSLSFVLFIIMVLYNIIKKRWSAVVYAGSFLGIVCLYSITYHINSGMEGLPRYSVWTFPIFMFYIVIENELSKKWINRIVAVTLIISMVLTVEITREYTTELMLTRVSELVMDYFPELYNPYYTIFISRVGKIAGGYTPYQEKVPEAISLGENYSNYLPVVYCDDEGNVRKILTIPELSEETPQYFEGSEKEMSNLQSQIVDEEGQRKLYYINLKGNIKIKDQYFNEKFAYVYGSQLKPSGRIPLSLFRITDKGEILDEKIIVHSEGFQYGPYLPLKKGKYIVTITGDNLDKFEEDALVDNELIEIKEIKKNSQQIQYEFEIQRDAMCVELRGLNQGKTDTVIYKIELNKAE